jgi:hypothetical protein
MERERPAKVAPVCRPGGVRGDVVCVWRQLAGPPGRTGPSRRESVGGGEFGVSEVLVAEQRLPLFHRQRQFLQLFARYRRHGRADHPRERVGDQYRVQSGQAVVHARLRPRGRPDSEGRAETVFLVRQGGSWKVNSTGVREDLGPPPPGARGTPPLKN